MPFPTVHLETLEISRVCEGCVSSLTSLAHAGECLGGKLPPAEHRAGQAWRRGWGGEGLLGGGGRTLLPAPPWDGASAPPSHCGFGMVPCSSLGRSLNSPHLAFGARRRQKGHCSSMATFKAEVWGLMWSTLPLAWPIQELSVDLGRGRPTPAPPDIKDLSFRAHGSEGPSCCGLSKNSSLNCLPHRDPVLCEVWPAWERPAVKFVGSS